VLPFVCLLPTVVPRPVGAPAADLKAFPRTYYGRGAGAGRGRAVADDGIAIGPDGAVLETALGNLWLRLESGWVTPALDGRVLAPVSPARGCWRQHAAVASTSSSGSATSAICTGPGRLAHSNAVYGPPYSLPARDGARRRDRRHRARFVVAGHGHRLKFAAPGRR
jgi:hypothetical protein